MTVDESIKTVTLTQTLTPIQEKVILGVDVPLYHSKSSINEQTIDSTVAVMQKLRLNDKEFTERWLNSKVDNQFDYSMVLEALKTKAFLTAIDDEEKSALIILKLLEFEHLPEVSNVVAWDLLDDFSLFFAKFIFADSSTVADFNEKFNKCCPSKKSFAKILYFFFGFNRFGDQRYTKELAKLSKEFAQYLESTCAYFKFPKATDSNNNEINEIMKLVNYIILRPFGNQINIYNVLMKFISVSYHNIYVMKIWSIICIQRGDIKQCKRTFKTYINYLNDNKVKNNGEYYDILDIVRTYCYVLVKLSARVTSNIDFEELTNWFDEAKQIFADIVNNVTGNDHSLYKASLKKIFSSIYFSFATIKENLLKIEPDPSSKVDEVKEYLLSTIKCVDKDLKVSPDFISFVFYKYSYYCHKTFSHEDSVHYAKQAIRYSPDDLKYINYYVKLLTGDEEQMDKALLITQQTIENLTEIVSHGNLDDWSLEKKKHAVECYLMFLTLLKDQYFVAIAPFFGFVNKIFDHGTTKTINGPQKTVKTQPSNQELYSSRKDIEDESCVPSCTNPANTLSTHGEKRHLFQSLRFKSKSQAVTGHNGSSHIRKSIQMSSSGISSWERQKDAPKKVVTQRPENSILKNMWIVLSRVFQSNGDLESAMECLSEFEAYMIPSRADRHLSGPDEASIDRCTFWTRKACLKFMSDTEQDYMEASKCLEDSLDIIENCGGARVWANSNSTASIYACAETLALCIMTDTNDHEDTETRNWHAIQQAKVAVTSVALMDDGSLLLATGRIAEAVRGWFGVKIFSS